MPKKWKWNDAYVQYGFTFITEKDGTQRPHCVLCGTMFSNANFKPSKLDEHFKNRHGGVNAGNNIATLQAKALDLTVPAHYVRVWVFTTRKIHSRINDMSKDILEQVIDDITANLVTVSL